MFPKNKNLQNKFFFKQNTQSGFGLIELLVSISILVLVMGVIMMRHNAFNGAVLLRSQAYEVALDARETQLFAVSIVGDSANFDKAYGLHFDKTSGSNQVYKIFRDSNDNGYFDLGEEFGRQGILDPRFEIDEIESFSGGSPTSRTNLSVIFQRPNFDAKFFTGANTEITNATAVQIRVRLKGTTGTGVGEVRKVEITKTGQISVI